MTAIHIHSANTLPMRGENFLGGHKEGLMPVTGYFSNMPLSEKASMYRLEAKKRNLRN